MCVLQGFGVRFLSTAAAVLSTSWSPPIQIMADASVASTEDVETVNNDLFERLPFLADAILSRLDSSAVLQLSCTCHAWRKAVQLCQVSLAPKSELAMPFVASCVHLRRLQLSHMQPAPGALTPSRVHWRSHQAIHTAAADRWASLVDAVCFLDYFDTNQRCKR